MALLRARIADELARLDKEEADLDNTYVARKTAISTRRRLLNIAVSKITDDLETIVDQLGIEVK